MSPQNSAMKIDLNLVEAPERSATEGSDNGEAAEDPDTGTKNKPVKSKRIRPSDIAYRPATPHDGAQMWRFVKKAGVLDLNQSYAYILMSQHFGNTCLVAEHDEQVVGFVLAYVPPRQPDTVFVWQIGVAKEARGCGVGLHLLRHLLALDGCRNVKYIEASITPSNKPSQSLFRAFARKWGVSCRKLPFFPSEFFPEPHEPEYLYRLGPLHWPSA